MEKQAALQGTGPAARLDGTGQLDRGGTSDGDARYRGQRILDLPGGLNFRPRADGYTGSALARPDDRLRTRPGISRFGSMLRIARNDNQERKDYKRKYPMANSSISENSRCLTR